MTKKESIIRCLQEGISAEETVKQVQGASISYIYKVRSAYKKQQGKSYKSEKQRQILTLSSRKVAPTTIAEEVGCSLQYVYKVVRANKKPKLKKAMDYICKEQDEYYTPLYAVVPIEKYLKKKSVIWCPFDTEESQYVQYFRAKGHVVVATHIKNGEDFFDMEPPMGCDYIISNPPYSCKEAVFERLYELEIPFGMLVNMSGLFNSKRRFDMFKDSVELMTFQTRVQYMTTYDGGDIMKAPPFESGYVCRGILEEALIFEEIDKQIGTIYKG